MRVIVNPKYAHLQKEIEEVPRSFQNEGDVVYDGRNVLKRISLGSIDVVVKSFKSLTSSIVLYIRFPPVEGRTFLYLFYGDPTAWF